MGYLFTMQIAEPRLPENFTQLDPGICISAGIQGDSSAREPLLTLLCMLGNQYAGVWHG